MESATLTLRRLAAGAGFALLAAFWWRYGLTDPHVTADGAAYWGVRDGSLYEHRWLNELSGGPVPYVYSPAFAQTIWPLVLLPLDLFMALWVAMNLAAVAWLVGPFVAAALTWLWPPVGLTNVWAGALYPMMAVALALSLRYPAMWAFQLLTKVTPGIGLLWHVARREWQALGWAAVTTVGVVTVSWAVWPDAWSAWIELLQDGAARTDYPPGTLTVPLSLRLLGAAGIIVVAARSDWRWLLPAGVMLAMPQVGWSTTVVLLAIPRLWRNAGPGAGRMRWSNWWLRGMDRAARMRQL